MTTRADGYATAPQPFATERFPPLTAWRSDRHPCRVHITAPADTHRKSTALAGRSAFCGIGAYATRKGPKVAVDIHAPLDDGETWCPRCLGQALVYLIGDALPVGLLRAALAALQGRNGQ